MEQVLNGNGTLTKKSGRFDWTKIHLVYFLLAGFDLIAIISGLSLSEWSKNAHLQIVEKLDQTNFLRGEIAQQQAFAIKLSAIANDIFIDKDVAKARADFKALADQAIAVSDNEAFKTKLAAKFPKQNLSLVISPDWSEDEANLFRHMTRLDPEKLRNFEKGKLAIKKQVSAMFDETRATVDSIAAGNMETATSHMGNSDVQFRHVLGASNASNLDLDNQMRETVDQSVITLNNSTWLQYLVGGSIFVMIGLACMYAFYVGRVLHRKFIEIQKSHEESVEHAATIEKVNTGITKLNAELADNMKRLSEAQDELVKKGRMEQLGQLTATVAHELRNPLGAVRTSSFLLERKLKDKGLNVETQLQRIAHGVTRCDDIITQLLDFSRTNKLVCHEGNLDQWLVKVVEDTAKQLPTMVAITCELGIENRLVPFDGARLERAIVNLVSNASEAMVGNGTEPSKIVTKDPHITISTELVGDSVLIHVIDNGPGMSAEILSKVREPLFTTKSFGTGLGLPAVEQIAYQHGGKLEIKSEEGKGSKFTLCLPMPIAVAEAA